MTVMLCPCILCVALLMDLFVLCVACLTLFVNCLVKQFAIIIIIFIRINNYTYRVHIKHLSTNYIKIFRIRIYK